MFSTLGKTIFHHLDSRILPFTNQTKEMGKSRFLENVFVQISKKKLEMIDKKRIF